MMPIKHLKAINIADEDDSNIGRPSDWNADHVGNNPHGHTSAEDGGYIAPVPGPQGEKGDKGDIGETGAQGIQGPAGADSTVPGPQGEKGDKGDQGEQGIQGVQGQTGSAGAQGEQGIQGPKGDKGDTGDTGPQGTQGPKGDTGDTGPQGVKGDTGDTGPQGNQGVQGEQGIQGVQGEPGPSGPASHMEIPVHADASANLTLTNQANSEQDLGNNVRSRKKVDLSWCTAFRVIGRLVTASASANNPRIYFRYSTNDSNYYAMDAADTAVSMSATGWKDTGWLDLVAGAKADNVYIRICQNGGDAAADPAWGNIHWIFK